MQTGRTACVSYTCWCWVNPEVQLAPRLPEACSEGPRSLSLSSMLASKWPDVNFSEYEFQCLQRPSEGLPVVHLVREPLLSTQGAWAPLPTPHSHTQPIFLCGHRTGAGLGLLTAAPPPALGSLGLLGHVGNMLFLRGCTSYPHRVLAVHRQEPAPTRLVPFCPSTSPATSVLCCPSKLIRGRRSPSESP